MAVNIEELEKARKREKRLWKLRASLARRRQLQEQYLKGFPERTIVCFPAESRTKALETADKYVGALSILREVLGARLISLRKSEVPNVYCAVIGFKKRKK